MGVGIQWPPARIVHRLPPEPRGTLRGGKMAELRIESGILRIHGSAFCFLSPPPLLRRFRVFVIAALGVGSQWPPPWNAPPEPHGAPRSGKIAELRVESGILGVRGSAFCFLPPTPIYGGFVYLEFPRWVLGVDGHPRGTSPGTKRNPAGRFGAAKWGNFE